MSTDHQRYSTENQRETIGKYAIQHGMVIAQTYADEGKSGLSLEGRSALQQLIMLNANQLLTQRQTRCA